MSDPNTVRILSLDGGGVRGYLSLKWLQRFIQQWGISSSELWKHFDVISGTSIGGIQALGYAHGRSPEFLEPFFLEKAKRIFTTRNVPIGCDADSDSSRPSFLTKIALIIQNDPFYKSACAPDAGNSNYGDNILQQTLVDNFGVNTLNNLKTTVLIPSYEKDTSKYLFFSNHNDLMFKGQNDTIVNVARATSAAPVYLPKHTFNGHDYIDGGIYQNNPADVALSLGKVIKPLANRFCVLSLGTGIGNMGFHPTVQQATVSDSAINDIFSLYDIASTGGQESVDFNLRLKSKRTLEQLYYYRFQPLLDPNLNTELDNSDVSFLNYMASTANSAYNEDIDNITTFLGHLMA